MLRNSFILIFCLFSSSYALNLDETINLAIANNKDLKSIEKSIDIANEQIKLSSKWENPILTIGANDLHFDTSRRDLEPMQAQYIGLSQSIPINNKLKLQEEISLKDKEIAALNFEDAKLKLKSTLIEYAYNLKILEQKYKLLNEYQKNIRDLENLSKVLYENDEVNQTVLLNLQTNIYKVELEKENLSNMIKNSYLKLEEITYEKIDNLVLPLELKDVLLNKELENHPKIRILVLNNQKFNKQASLEDAKKLSDIKVNVAYFQRDDKYKDYANISFSIPLALNNRENIKAFSAKLKASEFRDKLLDTKKTFEIRVLSLQNDLNSSYRKFVLLEKTIIPLQEKNQQTIENYNSLDLIKPEKLFINLNEIIKNRLASLDEVKNYFLAYSKAYYFTQGNIK